MKLNPFAPPPIPTNPQPNGNGADAFTSMDARNTRYDAEKRQADDLASFDLSPLIH